MSDQPTEIEQKMIEFATKTAQTIQNQAEGVDVNRLPTIGGEG